MTGYRGADEAARQSMRDRARTRRRQLGFAGFLVGCVAIVEAKAATAPQTHRVDLGQNSLGTPSTTGRAHPAPSRSGASTRGSGSAAGDRSIDGQAYDIGYGIVQVKVVLAGDRIVDVVPVQLPSGGRSSDIASFAVPELKSEVLAAQSAQIDMVSGASYTSYGYAKSVQSALDAAHG